jgi:hypothetical protein
MKVLKAFGLHRVLAALPLAALFVVPASDLGSYRGGGRDSAARNRQAVAKELRRMADRLEKTGSVRGWSFPKPA